MNAIFCTNLKILLFAAIGGISAMPPRKRPRTDTADTTQSIPLTRAEQGIPLWKAARTLTVGQPASAWPPQPTPTQAPHSAAPRPAPARVPQPAQAFRQSNTDAVKAIHSTAENGDIEAFKSLIAANPPLKDARGTLGKTPLHTAARHNKIDIANELLTRGVDVNVADEDGRTPLHYAALDGHTDMVNYLITNRANPNAATKTGLIPLHYAALSDQVDIIRKLITYCTNVNIADNQGRTALRFAVLNSRVDMVKLLLAHGADIHARDEDGDTPLDLAAYCQSTRVLEMLKKAQQDSVQAPQDASALPHQPTVHQPTQGSADVIFSAVEKGDIEAFKRLIVSNPSLMDARDREGNALLHIAAYNGHTDVVGALLAMGADIHARDKEGRTPLYIATYNGHKDVVEVLLANGADVNTANKYKVTPLHLAAYHCYASVAEVLLAHGADMHARDEDGRTPLHVAADCQSTRVLEMLKKAQQDSVQAPQDASALPHQPTVHQPTQGSADVIFSAVEKGDIEAFKRLIVSNPSLMDARDREGNALLHIAAYNGHTDVVGALLAMGADIHARDKEGRTPLYIATYNGHKDVVEVLLANGADVNTANKYKVTPLHLAAYHCYASVAEVLLAHGADMHARDEDGRTPLHVAADCQSTRVLEMLKKAQRDSAQPMTAEREIPIPAPHPTAPRPTPTHLMTARWGILPAPHPTAPQSTIQ